MSRHLANFKKKKYSFLSGACHEVADYEVDLSYLGDLDVNDPIFFAVPSPYHDARYYELQPLPLLPTYTDYKNEINQLGYEADTNDGDVAVYNDDDDDDVTVLSVSARVRARNAMKRWKRLQAKVPSGISVETELFSGITVKFSGDSDTPQITDLATQEEEKKKSKKNPVLKYLKKMDTLRPTVRRRLAQKIRKLIHEETMKVNI